MMFGSVSTAIPLVQSGKLKALAVTGRERMKAMPDLPTIEEGGLKAMTWKPSISWRRRRASRNRS